MANNVRRYEKYRKHRSGAQCAPQEAEAGFNVVPKPRGQTPMSFERRIFIPSVVIVNDTTNSSV